MQKSNPELETDVLIIGAGAAGLAAAAELSQTGLKVALIEARNRIGGRVFTLRDPITNFPIELGPEFIHGHPVSTLSLVNSSRLNTYDVLDTHYKLNQGRLEKVKNYWEEINAVTSRLKGNLTEDRSFSEFLKAHQSEFSLETARLAADFIEGFHASDMNEISEVGLSVSEQASENEDVSQMLRISEGYDHVIQGIWQKIAHFDEITFLNREVSSVTWRKNFVSLKVRHTETGQSETYMARKAIITLPIGVLKTPAGSQGSVFFDPMPEVLCDSLLGLRMGSVHRLTLRFHTQFWNDVIDDLCDEPVGFIHSPLDSPFLLWWTPLPMRRNYITAWTGGPRAERLAEIPREELITMALNELSKIVNRSASELRSNLLTSGYHDWTNDPYARGAYSYIAVGGKKFAKQLAEPIHDTLYFAGEGTHMGDQRGTVSGAIATGQRAAQMIIAKC